MNYQGKVYRPWMEADSLLIQTTLGCTHNKCIFCDMFSDKNFHIRDIEEVYKDIDEARDTYRPIRSIFLIDGNVLALKTEHLLNILNKIKSTIPECSKISLYAGLNDLRRKSIKELTDLRQAGLTLVYTGLETGDRITLERIQKGLTPEQAQEGMAKAKSAGIKVLASIIFGIGGKERSTKHIIETTKLLNSLQPEELAPMVLTIQPKTVLAEQVETGTFIQATPLQILEEEKYLLENMSFATLYWGNHGNNIVSSKGYLPESRELFLTKIKNAIANHPVTKQDILLTSPW